MKKSPGQYIALGLAMGLFMALALVMLMAANRYPVGQLVSASVYTEPFDPCDPAYKFLVPPPKDWAEKFGNNERTALIHAISELRVVVAAQGKRILALEDWQKKQPVFEFDPNEPKFELDVSWPQTTIGTKADPNEAKR